MISAVIALLQQPLFISMVGTLKGDPYWVRRTHHTLAEGQQQKYMTETFHLCHPNILQINLGLIIFSLAGFLLPGYLYYHRRQLLREKEAREERAAGQELQALNDGEANGYKPQSNGLAAVEA